jgi:hypothetical protein
MRGGGEDAWTASRKRPEEPSLRSFGRRFGLEATTRRRRDMGMAMASLSKPSEDRARYSLLFLSRGGKPRGAEKKRRMDKEKRPWHRRRCGRPMRWTWRHTPPVHRHHLKSPIPPPTTHRKLHIQIV